MDTGLICIDAWEMYKKVGLNTSENVRAQMGLTGSLHNAGG